MDNEKIEIYKKQVMAFAEKRRRCVAEGKESSHVAALLLQNYGLGVTDTIAVTDAVSPVADMIARMVNEEVEKIDPDWRQHAVKRQKCSPTDLNISCN